MPHACIFRRLPSYGACSLKAAKGAHSTPPRIRGNIVVRSAVLGFGLAIFAIGIVSIYVSKLGLSPWDVLNQGVAKHTPLSFGMANIAIALLILVVARRLDVRLQVGTVANALLVGTFVDLLLRIGAVQDLAHDGLPVRIGLLVAGILVIGLGTGLYIGANLGAGPRDSLMLGVTRRVRSRVGVVRTALEVSATAAGFALGGTVGVGTLAFALGIGPAVELSFALLARSALVELAPARA
ncbi:MAG: hypothetical protein QOH15_3340 [Gaiellales bacterium]|jgi:uncharacterized membrane protein YczE|nr:hypothetical protein [Gaiellales bacterium]